MDITAPTLLPVTHLDTLSFVGLERTHLRSAVYRRVFGDDAGPVRIGRYSLLERVGSGARGVVFKAFDNQLDRLVALKVLSTRADDHEELIREAKALARLSHPNVLAVYEVGETEDGQVFLATEYVKGWTLRGWYDEETRGEAAIVEVIRQVARGVQAAHDEGLVHRDLKPANILLGHDGRVRVADFGLARFDPAALQPAAGIPRDGLATTTAGTPGYMAPELFCDAPASAASDQYALAVTLHELLFGQLPEHDGPATPRRVGKTVASAVRRGLAESPELRFPTVGAFADALVAASRSPLRRAIPWVAGLSVLAGSAAAIWAAAPMGQRSADNELARLSAQAALPEHPAAALDELRKASDLSDPRLRPIAERALALGPENARYALPKGAHDLSLMGSILVFRDAQDAPAALRLHHTGPVPMDAAALGFVAGDRDTFWPDTYRMSGTRVALEDAHALAAVDPRAARRFADEHRAIAVSGNTKRVATPSEDGTSLTIEDTSTDETWSLDRKDERVGSISLDASGERVAWTEGNGNAFVYELFTGVMTQLEPAASRVLFEPSGDSLIVQGRFSGVFRVDLRRSETIRLLAQDERFGRIELSPDGAWLAALGPSDEITVTNLAASVPRVIVGSSFEFSPDGTRLAVLDGDHLEVHDLVSSDVQTFAASGGVASFDFSDAQTLWVAGTDGFVRRHDVHGTRALRGHTASVRDVALSSDGAVALSIAEDFTVRRWDVDSGAGRVLAELDSSSNTIALDEGAGRIAVTRHRDSTMLFDVESGARFADAPHSLARPVVGPEGALFGAGDDGVWRDVAGASTVLASDLGSCPSLAATEQWVAAACSDGEVKLHVWADGKHNSIPISGRLMGSSLHAWPDAQHLYFIGGQEQLVHINDSGDLELLESPRLLGEPRAFSFPAASSSSHDLVVRKRGGVHAVWDTSAEAIPLFDSDSGTVAISGDGLRVAHATGRYQIVVRDRALSKSRPTVGTTLEAFFAAGIEH